MCIFMGLEVKFYGRLNVYLCDKCRFIGFDCVYLWDRCSFMGAYSNWVFK